MADNGRDKNPRRDVTDGVFGDYRDEIDYVTGEPVAWDRADTDSCERGTFGCSIHHTRDSECQTW